MGAPQPINFRPIPRNDAPAVPMFLAINRRWTGQLSECLKEEC